MLCLRNLNKVSKCLISARPYSAQASASVVEKVDKPEDEPMWELKNPYEKPKKQCILCKHKIEVDYKNAQLLSQFVSPYTGQLYDKHITGLCDQQQQIVKDALKLTYKAGLMPQYHKDVKFVKDPKLFDSLNPTRPHPY